MRPLSQVANDLFEKIKNNFKNISLGDKDAQSTINPEDAIFFNFDYSKDGKNLGNITISLLNHRLQVFYSNNITDSLDEVDRQQWYRFLKDLRGFAMRNMMEFDVRDISKPNLSLRDIKTMSQGYNDRYSLSDVNESKMWGSTKSSYQNIGSTRMIVRHSNTVDENKFGARGRNIRAIYIENKEGERFKIGNNNLLTGRIIARHISNGGQANDAFSNHVMEMVNELRDLRYFVRHNKNKTYEDVTTKEMVEAAQQYYGALRETLKSLKGERGYKNYIESWKPDNSQYVDPESVKKEDLKERFIERSFNERLERALPHIAKAYQLRVSEQKSLQETIDAYIKGQKNFNLTNEDKELFNLVEYKDSEGLVKFVLESLAQKTKEVDSIISKFAESAARNWSNLNPAQKSLAVSLSKSYVKEAKLRNFIPGLGKIQAKNLARKHRANAYYIAHNEMNPTDRGPTDPESKFWDPNTEANREHKRAFNFGRIAKGNHPFRREGLGEDTIYDQAKVIKNKKGKPIGEIYPLQDDSGEWGAFHYGLDSGAEGFRNEKEANEEMAEMHQSFLDDLKRHRSSYKKLSKFESTNIDEDAKQQKQYDFHKRKANELSKEIDKIVTSGGRVGLNDPLSRRYTYHAHMAKKLRGKKLPAPHTKEVGEARKAKPKSEVSKIDLDSARRK